MAGLSVCELHRIHANPIIKLCIHSRKTLEMIPFYKTESKTQENKVTDALSVLTANAGGPVCDTHTHTHLNVSMEENIRKELLRPSPHGW